MRLRRLPTRSSLPASKHRVRQASMSYRRPQGRNLPPTKRLSSWMTLPDPLQLENSQLGSRRASQSERLMLMQVDRRSNRQAHINQRRRQMERRQRSRQCLDIPFFLSSLLQPFYPPQSPPLILHRLPIFVSSLHCHPLSSSLILLTYL